MEDEDNWDDQRDAELRRISAATANYVALKIKKELEERHSNPELPVEVDGGAAKRPQIRVADFSRQSANIDEPAARSALCFNPSILDATIGSAVNRDPRMRKRRMSQNPPNSAQSNPQPNGSHLSPDSLNALPGSLRRPYLEEPQTSSDSMGGPLTKVSRPDNQFRDIANRCTATQQLINSPSSSFYANISGALQYDDELLRQRSPLAVSRNNAPLVSQATDDNIRDALLGQHYRNIPSHLQTLGNYAGADLGQISQAMGPPDFDGTAEISSSSNTRSFYTQTSDSSGVNDRPAAETETQGTQTTKNCGYFSYTIDNLSALTKEQRVALEVFKTAMNIKDEPTISGIAERLEHRSANKAYQEWNNNKAQAEGESNRSSEVEHVSSPLPVQRQLSHPSPAPFNRDRNGSTSASGSQDFRSGSQGYRSGSQDFRSGSQDYRSGSNIRETVYRYTNPPAPSSSNNHQK